MNPKNRLVTLTDPYEIAESLKLGDHLRHDRQLLRGIATLGIILTFSMRGKKHIPRRRYIDMTFVVSNPVAHGSRLARAVQRALGDFRTSSVCDLRIGTRFNSTATYHFPSLTALSFFGWVNLALVVRVIKLRRAVTLAGTDYPTLSRLYLEALFLLQAIRYDLARQMVEDLPASHLWLFDFDRHAYCRPLAWWAGNLKRRTVTLVHGSPNANYCPTLAGHVIVWGEAQARWFQARDSKISTHIVGRPELNLTLPSASLRALRIVHSLEALTNTERDFLIKTCEDAKRLGLKVSLRLHPSARESDLRSGWESVRALCSLEDSSIHFLDSLQSGEAIVGVCSTAVVDALASGLPAWLAADQDRELPCDLEVVRNASITLRNQVFGGAPDIASSDCISPLDDVRRHIVHATDDEAAQLFCDAISRIQSSGICE